MSISIIISIIASSLILFGFGVLFKTAPNDYPDFHEKNPYHSYRGIKLSFGLVKITNSNWSFIKKTMFRAFAAACLIHIVLSIALIITIPEISAESIMSNALVLMAFAFIYIIIRVGLHKD